MRDEKHLLFRGVRKPFCKMLKHLSLWPRGEGGFIPQVSERAAPGIPSHPDPPHAHSRTHTCPAGVVTMVSLAYILPQLLAKSLFSRTLSLLRYQLAQKHRLHAPYTDPRSTSQGSLLPLLLVMPGPVKSSLIKRSITLKPEMVVENYGLCINALSNTLTDRFVLQSPLVYTYNVNYFTHGCSPVHL